MPQLKPLTWLVLLLLLNVLLLSFQVRNSEGLILLRVWGQFLFSPVAATIQAGSSGLSDLSRRYVFLAEAESDNEQLRKENARLLVEVNRLRGLARLLPRTRDYEILRNTLHWRFVPGAVIARSAPFLSHRVVINLGTSSGIGRDCAVFVSEGLVGRVSVCGRFSAEVELIVNERAAAGALLEGSRIQGIVQGTGSRLLELNYVPNSQSVQVGEKVFTSGTDRVYPKGLPIGRVVEATPGTVVYQEPGVALFIQDEQE